MMDERKVWRGLATAFAGAVLLGSAAHAASTVAAEAPTATPAGVPVSAEPAKPAEAASDTEAPKPAETPAEPKRDPLKTPVKPPLGTAGASRVGTKGGPVDDHFTIVPDRWRLGMPDWSRYRAGLGAPYVRGNWWNPYTQNVLKGDYPIRGQNTFLNISAVSDTLVDFSKVPIASPPSAALPHRYGFFAPGELGLIDQTFVLSAELFHGDTSFRPRDWAVRLTPQFNINYLHGRETGIPDIDPREGRSRLTAFGGFQEAFGEYKITDLSKKFDFLSLRAGIQAFTADPRGHLLVEDAPALRFFGTSDSNRNQFNLAYFRPLEKDTYSRINDSFRDREQDIFVANFYRQDLFVPGYTGQLIAAYNHDRPSTFFNRNGVQERPALIGDGQPHAIHAGYVGFNGEGHVGRLNVSHTFYQAFGYDSHNGIAERSTRIDAQMGAVELSYDRDWARFHTAFFYASGDKNPRDGRAQGFDAIFDSPIFAGGEFSFWNSQGIRLTGSNVSLMSPGSFLPDLRSSKLQGQANFVNPGLWLINAGVDMDLTPKWKLFTNVNWLNFVKTQPLELILNQSDINKSIGFDFSVGVRHRPFLNENIILTAGVSALVPGSGFRDIYTNKTLFSVFSRLSLSF